MSTALGGSTSHQPVEVRTDTPQSARLYDYYLGGKTNFPADREAAQEVFKAFPSAREFARANRAFLRRSVGHLAREAGVTQFLDIGTGIPTSPNTHELAQASDPSARVVYVDHDPIVLAHARALLDGTPEGRIDYIQADLRDPESILGHPCLSGPRAALDLTRPVALQLVAVLHFLVDEDRPHEVVRTLLDALPSGSFLTVSHFTADFRPEEIQAAARAYRAAGVQCANRPLAAVERFAEGLEVIPPGIVPLPRWRAPAASAADDSAPAAERSGTGPDPDFDDGDVSCYAFVARKP
jgi:hypothetical protein